MTRFMERDSLTYYLENIAILPDYRNTEEAP